MMTRMMAAFLVVFQFFWCAGPVVATTSELRGPAFSDPNTTAPMPDDWKTQSVVHKENAEPAALFVDLNQQLYPVLLPLVNAFAKANNLKIVVSKGTCGKSGGMLGRKEIDIGSFCCPPGTTDRLPGLRFHTLGIIPLAILIHPENPVDDVSYEQVQKIFMGEITHWSDLGGQDRLIKTIGSIHCQAKPGDWRLLLANEDLFSPHLLEVGDMPDMISHVANDPGAIGYEVLLVAEQFKDRGQVKALKINGMHPRDLDFMQKGHYPFYRTYTMTTWEGDHIANPQADKLVQYLIRQVENIDRSYGLVPASRLRASGWKFKDNELIGEPDGN